jgi:hypothetical protein
VGQRENALFFNMNKNFYFEELQSFNLFCDGPIKMANCEKKKVELGKNIICLEHFGIYIVG